MKKVLGILLVCMMLMGVACADGFDTGRDITVISREDGSGTRGAFAELLGVEIDGVDATTEEAIVSNSTAACLTAVAGNEYAIGYISLGSLNDTVKAVSVNGVAATAENIVSGDYTVARPFLLATGADVSPLAADFIAYILSAEGQAVVSEKGYVSVGEAEAYVPTAISGKIVVGGSSSVTPVMEKLAEAYKAVNPNAEIEVQQSDSTTGMNGVREGVLDIGMASRELKDSELEAGLVPTKIAVDGIAIIVNVNNPTDDMTPEQIRAIYMGDTTKWADAQ